MRSCGSIGCERLGHEFGELPRRARGRFGEPELGEQRVQLDEFPSRLRAAALRRRRGAVLARRRQRFPALPRHARQRRTERVGHVAEEHGFRQAVAGTAGGRPEAEARRRDRRAAPPCRRPRRSRRSGCAAPWCRARPAPDAGPASELRDCPAPAPMGRPARRDPRADRPRAPSGRAGSSGASNPERASSQVSSATASHALPLRRSSGTLTSRASISPPCRRGTGYESRWIVHGCSIVHFACPGLQSLCTYNNIHHNALRRYIQRLLPRGP